MTPEMPEAIQQYYSDLCDRSDINTVLEYGAGGSTLIPLSKGITTIAVDTDQQYLEYVATDLRKMPTPGFYHGHHVDIGQTKAWGYPVNEIYWRAFPDYAKSVWQYMEQNDLCPDLILIDGRFRKACLMTCMINCPDAIILLDDWAHRPYYRINILGPFYVEPNQVIDRMAIFEPSKIKRISGKTMLYNLEAFYDPR